MVTVPQNQAVLLKESPAEHTFKLHKTAIEIRSISELADALEIITDESFNHHVSECKNDFATWVKEILHDEELSNRLRAVKDRHKAQQVVRNRIRELTAAGKVNTYKSAVFGFGLWEVAIGFVAGLIIGLLLGHYLIPRP